MSVALIICPRCLMHSAGLGDIAEGNCGHCRAVTRGRVVQLPRGTTAEAQREQALYAVALFAARALALGATVGQVMEQAGRPGLPPPLAKLHTDALLHAAHTT